MNVKIKKGNLDDFLTSACATAKEIDAGKKVTRKKTVWVEPDARPCQPRSESGGKI
jgi:hypothetical protein